MDITLGDIAGANGRNSKVLCQGGEPGTGKLYTDVWYCDSAHTRVCVVLQQRIGCYCIM